MVVLRTKMLENSFASISKPNQQCCANKHTVSSSLKYDMHLRHIMKVKCQDSEDSSRCEETFTCG